MTWILVGMLLVGCAAPTADWKALRAQDGAQRERDWQSCVPALDPLDMLGILFLSPYYRREVRHEEAIGQCMERAGYERARPSQ